MASKLDNRYTAPETFDSRDLRGEPLDPAEIERRLRADGVQFVESEPVDLDRLYALCRSLQEQRRLRADEAALHVELAHAGAKLESWTQTFNFWRDRRGNLLSAELEFVSQASTRHDASDTQIAAVLYPNRSIGASDLDAVQKMRRALHRRRVVVRYECNGCDACDP